MLEGIHFQVIDFETTGTDPKKNKACSFAAFDLDSNEHFYSLINPEIPILPEASEVNHLVTRDVISAPSQDQVMRTWLRDLGKPDCIIAHNVAFDKTIMDQCNSLGSRFPWICSMRLAKKLWPDDPSRNQYLRYKHEIEVKIPEGIFPHHALYDVYVTAGVFRYELKVLEGLSKDPSKITLEKLISWIEEPILLRTCHFGKHKGQPWKDVPRSYLEWMLKNMTDMDRDLKHTINTLLSS
jgi:exodeoxyribonuclease X